MTEKEELLLQLKWLFISIVLCGLVGSIIAGFQVLLFEQTTSGKYAVNKECTLWSESCIKDCEDHQYDNPGRPPSCECCLKYDDITSPLGKRIKELSWRYTLYGGSFGIVIGLIIAEEKKRKASM